MNKSLLISVLTLILSGCAGMPVGYGGTHAAIQSSNRSVTYIYDPLVGGRSSAENAATEYCRGLGKSAAPAASGNQGILQIQTYDCRSAEGYATTAGENSSKLEMRMQSGYEKSSKCMKELLDSPNGKEVTKSLLVMSAGQENKYDLYSSKSRLSEAQKKLLKPFLMEQAKCNHFLSDAASSTPYAVLIAKRNSAGDVIYTKLLSGQITIGEANLAVDQQSFKIKEEAASVRKSVQDGFKNSQNAEIAEDAESKRRLANSIRENQQLQQSQQLINQNQQMINNQMQQNIKPAIPRAPVQTNCTSYGAGTINCTTY